MTHTVDATGREHEVTLPEELQAVEQRHAGWHAWLDGNGKTWATQHPGDSGQEVTVGGCGVGQLDRQIAEVEHAQQHEARYLSLMGGAVA